MVVTIAVTRLGLDGFSGRLRPKKGPPRCSRLAIFAKVCKLYERGDPFFRQPKKGTPRACETDIFANPTFSLQRGDMFFKHRKKGFMKNPAFSRNGV